MGDFIVSARKYRPATFASVVGQKHITSTLKNAIERNQLAHAYLFCGPRGVGKTTCARIFAKAINCLAPSGAEACNECESCRAFNEGRSLNIHELDAASNNSVDDIRNLIDQVRVVPQLGHYSVFIIDEVHMLSTAAFNAFLKTLEEPPQHAIFILATTEKHKIIPTILSRCQIYDFNRIRVEDAVEYLRYIASNEGVTADEESLNLIAQKADGGMRDALSMFDKAVSFCGTSLEYRSVAQTLNVLDYDTYFRFTDLLRMGDYVNALLEFDAVLSKGFSGQIFMNGLNQHMRDLLVAKGPAISLIEYTGSLLERYRAQAAECDTNFLFGTIALLSEADGRIRTSSNQRLTVELALMKAAAMGQKKNSPLTAPIVATPNALPDLTNPVRTATPLPAQPVAQQAQRVTTPQPAQQPAPQPVQATVSTQPVQQSVEEPTPRMVAQPQAAAPTQTPVQVRPTPQPERKANILNLTDMLNRANGGANANAPASQIVIDPESENKIRQAKEEISRRITEISPRFGVAFAQIAVSGNRVSIVVPTTTLKEEIVAEQSKIVSTIAEAANVKGAVELNIEVREIEIKMRPIKLEDRVAYMQQHVPLFDTLRKTLDLDIE